MPRTHLCARQTPQTKPIYWYARLTITQPCLSLVMAYVVCVCRFIFVRVSTRVASCALRKNKKNKPMTRLRYLTRSSRCSTAICRNGRIIILLRHLDLPLHIRVHACISPLMIDNRTRSTAFKRTCHQLNTAPITPYKNKRENGVLLTSLGMTKRGYY